ncbi:MAG: translation initiation factor IF-3 [Candidatus Shapirobacteria bacterium]|nr:translation initiation factor IF-3 [Candidatus Shapirobacteria bacterium]
MSKKFNKFYRINQYIQAEKVRVVDEEGAQIGIMNFQEALRKAQEKKLDLIEVGPKAVPPVCRIIDFKKFKYLEAKKEQEEKKKNKKTEIKEIRLGLFMADNDLNFRLNHVEKFLKDGNKVKITLKLRGRQIAKKDLAFQLIDKVKEKISSFAKLESDPKMIGKQLEMLVSPLKNK